MLTNSKICAEQFLLWRLSIKNIRFTITAIPHRACSDVFEECIKKRNATGFAKQLFFTVCLFILLFYPQCLRFSTGVLSSRCKPHRTASIIDILFTLKHSNIYESDENQIWTHTWSSQICHNVVQKQRESFNILTLSDQAPFLQRISLAQAYSFFFAYLSFLFSVNGCLVLNGIVPYEPTCHQWSPHHTSKLPGLWAIDLAHFVIHHQCSAH